MEKIKSLKIKLAPAVHWKLKMYCLRKKSTMQSVVEELVKNLISK